MSEQLEHAVRNEPTHRLTYKIPFLDANGASHHSVCPTSSTTILGPHSGRKQR
jgi:hypothetical protein